MFEKRILLKSVRVIPNIYDDGEPAIREVGKFILEAS